MKKITSFLMLFLILLGIGNVKAQTTAPTLDGAIKQGKLLTAEQLNGFTQTKRIAIQLISQSTSNPNPKDCWFKVNAAKPHFQRDYDQTVYVDWIPVENGKHIMKFVSVADGYVKNTDKLQLGAMESAQPMSVVLPVLNGDGDAKLATSNFLPADKYQGYFCRFMRTTESYINANQDNWHNGKGEWTVFFAYDIEVPAPSGDYPSAVAEGVAYKDPNGRRLEGVTLTVNGKAQTHMLSTPLTVYTKALDRHFVVKPGDEVTPTFNYFIKDNNPWMHGYVFVDFGQDGQFSSKVTAEGVPEANSDLKSFSYYNGKDSKGVTAPESGVAKATCGNTIPCPSFTIPSNTKPGVYYMRYMVDYNNIDAKSLGKTDMPMAICDIALYVVGTEGNVTVANQNLGTVTAVDGSKISTTAATNQDFQFKINANNAGDILGASVRHGFNLTGEQVVKGLTQYQEDQFLANGEGIITIPAAYMDGDIQITPVKTDEVLIFADEFNSEVRTKPNADIWACSPRYSSVWNRLVSKADDVVYMENGNLVCRALKNATAIEGETIKPGDVNMRTGAVQTTGPKGFNFRYGRVECRAKANPFEGTFPAIWMMPTDGTGGWPNHGEIDIFELVNTENKAHHTIHTNWTWQQQPQHPNTHNEQVDYSQYHVYGLEWDDKNLKFYLDGKLQWTYSKDTSKEAITKRQWPFNRNFYLILNQSVGRDNEWAHRPDENHVYEFFIDWIRVYQNPHHAAECELRAKIEEFEEYKSNEVDGFREGQKVCEYTINNEALTAAKAVLKDAKNQSVQQLKDALKSLDQLYVLNQPKQNHFYRMRCADNNMRYVQSTVNGNGKLDMKKSGVEEKGDGVAATFLYTDKGLVSYVNGQYCGGESLKAVGENAVARFGNVRNGRLGAYTIQLGADANNSLKGDGTTLAVKFPTNDLNNNSSNWWLEQVDNLQVTFKGNETSGYYATIYSPAALTIPAGVTAYTGKKGTDYVTLTAITENVIPAKTAVLLKLDNVSDANKTKEFVVKYDDTAAAPTTNDFVGSVETEKGSGNFYGLGYGSLESHKNTVGFYILDNSKNMKGFRARLAKGTTQVNGLRMVFDGESTGIEAVDALLSGKAGIYDMSGRRVMNPTKGLYIVNGKKVYFK